MRRLIESTATQDPAKISRSPTVEKPNAATLEVSYMSGTRCVWFALTTPVSPSTKAPQISAVDEALNVFFGWADKFCWVYSSISLLSLLTLSVCSKSVSASGTCSISSTSSITIPPAILPRGPRPCTVSISDGDRAPEFKANRTCASWPSSTAWQSPIASVERHEYSSEWFHIVGWKLNQSETSQGLSFRFMQLR